MLIRVVIVFMFLAALASFGYGFWLVLSPEGHQWRVEIPLDDQDPRSRDRAAAARADDAAAAERGDDETAADRGDVATAADRGDGETPGASVPASPAPDVARAASEPPSDPVPSPAPAARIVATSAAAASLPGGEPPITLSLPIACDPGVDCWVVNYVDLDPSGGRADYMCGQMSYDGHKGTDFGLANESLLANSVPVLAAAAGKVVGVRDGEADAGRSGIEAAKAAGKECGNGVRIEHGDGWVTQYCHLRRGSVLVQGGQQVEAGEILGAVGLSGVTEFPHVHVSVSHEGRIVDPFQGVDGGESCSVGNRPLWEPSVLQRLTAIRAPTLLDLAFSDGIPGQEAAEAGTAARASLTPEADAVVVWYRAIGVSPGDTGRVVIEAPDGAVILDQTETFERHQSYVFRALGVRNSQKRFPRGLPAGDWRGRVVLERGDGETDDRTVSMRVGTSG